LLTGELMEPSELELVSTSELIDELLRRKTFLGVLVHSEEELKADGWQGTRLFKVRFNDNLSAAEAARLLDVVAEHMGQEEK
jgi:hypothetical protein